MSNQITTNSRKPFAAFKILKKLVEEMQRQDVVDKIRKLSHSEYESHRLEKTGM
jgi:hypothetical protein